VVEVILERVTNISMAAAEIDAVNESQELAVTDADAPTSNLTVVLRV
jgi:tartronate-semialdehyde synthase